MHLDDTIVAIATPPGRGGIGVVRLSGNEACSIAQPMLRLAHALEAGRAHFGELIEPATGERIDEVVATYFAKPHSYTTDDVVEISCHGSPVVLQHVVETAMKAGARLAEPGEFTMRAFLNGRIDLTQAEAVRDLIESQTLYQAQVAARQLEGSLSKRLQPIKQQLIELIAIMEAGVDFAEDDVSITPDAQILARIAAIRAPLEELLASFAFGKIVHEGLTLAIVGRPNVGKSSLFNRLVERERAIVTAMPGTTRDLVSETVAIGGIPVRLVDTAGIRTALDEAESIGVRKSMEALADADIVLVVRDASRATSLSEDETTSGRAATGAGSRTSGSCGVEQNRRFGRCWIQRRMALTQWSRLRRSPARASTSSVQAFCNSVGGEGGAQQESGLLTNIRQKQLVSDSIVALDKATAGGSAENSARDDSAGPLRGAASARRYHRRDHC